MEVYMMEDDLGKMLRDKWEEAVRARGAVNILIVGKTGVGKSTLINSVFEGELAATGMGRPVTKHVRQISKEGIPVSIFDTRGLELDDYDGSLQELRQFIAERKQRQDPNESTRHGFASARTPGALSKPSPS
jgi:predicted GTPase